ncbi:YggT family protein [Secundilactobacillus paracollinoides]|uniref:YggT family protein n=1 Tax=Secundilactobacillus paracollinoides TaxID=240427 RepID=UPI003F7329EA
MIYWVLSHLIELYSWAIVIYALLSWFPGAYQTAFGQFLARIVEPFQRWFNFAHIDDWFCTDRCLDRVASCQLRVTVCCPTSFTVRELSCHIYLVL